MSVSSRILITETWSNLEIFIDSADHEELLVLLRSLWEGVEFTWMETAWDEEIASSLRTRRGKNRRLDVEEVARCEPIPRMINELGSEHKIIKRLRPAEIHISVFIPYLFICFGIFVDLKWRCFGPREDLCRVHNHFYLTRGELVIGLTFWASSDFSGEFYHVFASKRIGYLPRIRIVLRIEHCLSQPVSVTQIDENNTTMITSVGYPTGYCYFLTDVCCCEATTRMCSIHKKF